MHPFDPASNVVRLLPPVREVSTPRLLPRASTGPRCVGDVARAQIVHQAIQTSDPVGSLAALDMAVLRKCLRETKDALQFFRGGSAVTKSWRAIFRANGGDKATLRALALHAQRQAEASRLLCDDYRYRARLLKWAIQLKRTPTPAA